MPLEAPKSINTLKISLSVEMAYVTKPALLPADFGLSASEKLPPIEKKLPKKKKTIKKAIKKKPVAPKKTKAKKPTPKKTIKGRKLPWKV